MNELQALRWILKQPGLMIVVGKNGTVALTYGHCFEITAANIIDAVIELQKAQIVKDDVDVRSCSGAICQNCFNCEATMQTDGGDYLCFKCYNAVTHI